MYLYLCVHVRTHILIYVCVFVYTHARTHIHIVIYMHYICICRHKNNNGQIVKICYDLICISSSKDDFIMKLHNKITFQLNIYGTIC